LVSVYSQLVAAVRAGLPVALATVIDGPGVGGKLLVSAGTGVGTGSSRAGTLGNPELDAVVAREAEGELAVGSTRVRRYGPRGEALRDDVSVFIESFVPPARMIIFGAVDFSAALTQVAKVLGYRVTLCDARAAFATRDRFPLADEVVVDWPHQLLAALGAELTPRDAVCLLTHDIKFDIPAIIAALGTKVGYLGAMGSRRSHADRVKRLREAGVDDAGLARLHAPIGLDLGALTPEETAISICAEIIAARTASIATVTGTAPTGTGTAATGGTTVRSLSATDGPIHHQAPNGFTR
jgi:xanthine dehydrogenase accessory factor